MLVKNVRISIWSLEVKIRGLKDSIVKISLTSHADSCKLIRLLEEGTVVTSQLEQLGTLGVE